MIILTFYLLSESSNSLNSGIITSIFASSIIFSLVNFRVLYGQRIKISSLVGIVLVITSISLISMGELKSENGENN